MQGTSWETLDWKKHKLESRLAGEISITSDMPILFLFYFWLFGFKACGILAPWPGTKPTPGTLEGKVLTTGLPGKSQHLLNTLTSKPQFQVSDIGNLWPEDLGQSSEAIPRMSTFTLAISCLTTSNLPWFMDLTFQVPMQYCSLQHQTLLLSPVTSTAGYRFCFGSIPSFFLELFLHWSQIAYWAPTDLGSSSFSILSFCLFILFSRQEYWSGLPFPSPVDHILSDTNSCEKKRSEKQRRKGKV